MIRFFINRFLQMIVAMWIITVLVFLLVHITGSPVDILLPEDARQEDIDRLIEHWGLDRPLHIQYLSFLGNAVQGDLGESLKFSGRNAADVVLERFPATLQLGAVAVFISYLIAIPLGVLSGVHKGTLLDTSASVVTLLGQSLPNFWVGIMLMWLFAVTLGLLPTSGYGGLRYMVLPVAALAWYQIAALTRLTRSSMVEVLDMEYIKLARLKGVPESGIVWKHALKNAAIVPLTYTSVLLGNLLKGSVVIETVFSWPGVGWLAIDAIRGRDFPVIQSVVLLFALLYLVLNFLVDVLYAYVDPRIRT
jgi:peptide/nickel transport system permease protein